MKTTRKVLGMLGRISISIAMLIFLFRMVDLRNLVASIKEARFILLVLAFTVFSLNYILAFVRWRELFTVVKIRPPDRKLIIAFTGGIVFNLFLPTSIGGDLVRSIDLAAQTRKPREVVATVIMDRLSGFVGLMILALCASVFSWRLLEDRVVLSSLIIMVVILAAILFILFNTFLYEKISKFLKNPDAGKIKEALAGVHEHLHNFKKHGKLIVGNILLSILIQSVTPVVFYIMARAMGLPGGIVQFLIVMPIIGAISLAPISIGGLGVRDAAVVFFFVKIGIGRDAAFAMSLLSFVFMVLYSAAAGLFYVSLARVRK
ncbi:MAG: lysylphosphatidylglycerol synthase transmembrane domain-containing protein [Candidatus Omnitrophica bacterium]|nr:lysylphosphatidylglycerol synthase transmembrane domain-containing protein [Candidatus Omnitrophota bacterium]